MPKPSEKPHTLTSPVLWTAKSPELLPVLLPLRLTLAAADTGDAPAPAAKSLGW
ncbi:hypothetical protein PtA15_1A578 [Puccinia triticina]|uniref:Uncharacterized protein n=1 Tax=Puccinia triticina TaxID=208348 RepID=A0ABY7CA27_9BASI|nr:uncharacterized protein PtA15_1A578 [Puccinia triticina]WAQ81238.1 hypothetical protein PtA15_1A578 [Puccinia triticina]